MGTKKDKEEDRKAKQEQIAKKQEHHVDPNQHNNDQNPSDKALKNEGESKDLKEANGPAVGEKKGDDRKAEQRKDQERQQRKERDGASKKKGQDEPQKEEGGGKDNRVDPHGQSPNHGPETKTKRKPTQNKEEGGQSLRKEGVREKTEGADGEAGDKPKSEGDQMKGDRQKKRSPP